MFVGSKKKYVENPLAKRGASALMGNNNGIHVNTMSVHNMMEAERLRHMFYWSPCWLKLGVRSLPTS